MRHRHNHAADGAEGEESLRRGNRGGFRGSCSAQCGAERDYQLRIPVRRRSKKAGRADGKTGHYCGRPTESRHARQSGAHAVPVRHPGNPVHLLQPENHVHEFGTLQNERLRTRIHEILRQLPDDKACGDGSFDVKGEP